MNKKILITGASGLIGKRLTELLLQKGYQVSHLGRNKREGNVPSFVWDINKGEIDPKALTGINSIIHLAGASVADNRWTKSRKKEILDSRIKSSYLLYEILKNKKHTVTSFVSASAIGYYGLVISEEVFTEDCKPGTDFLAQVTQQWEAEVDKINSLGIRVVKLRIGIVLSEKGGALAEMAKPIKLGFGASLGSGKQYMTWIHLDDLCELFIKASEDQNMTGAYNAVGPEWTTNSNLAKSIAQVLKKPLWLPPIPNFMLYLILGEVAGIILSGHKISSTKVQNAGFTFKFTKLEEALGDLLLE